MSHGLTVTESPSVPRSAPIATEAGPSERKKVTFELNRGFSADVSLGGDTTTVESPMPVKKLDFMASPEQNVTRPLRKTSDSDSQLFGDRSVGSESIFRDIPAQPSPMIPSDYYTKPSLEELERESSTALKSCVLEVGRRGFGSIRWLQPVDLSVFLRSGAAHRGLDVIPGQVVKFTRKMCSVYEDEDENKHARGVGLNCPAEITLTGCWPLDRNTRQPVTTSSSPRMKQFVSKLKSIPETEFMNYDPVSGTWKFRVLHFSRYGILDDDDDDEENIAPSMEAEESMLVSKVSRITTELATDDADMDTGELEGLAQPSMILPDDMEDTVPTSSRNLPAGLDSRRVHQMRRNFFPPQADQQQSGPIRIQPRATPLKEDFQFEELKKQSKPIPSTEAFAKFLDPTCLDLPVANQRKDEMDIYSAPKEDLAKVLSRPPVQESLAPVIKAMPSVSLADSYVAGRERSAKDKNLMLARSFRVGWGMMPTANGTKLVLVQRSNGTNQVQLRKVAIGTMDFKDPEVI